MSNTQKAIGFYNQDGTATIYGNTGGRGGSGGASTIRIIYDESPATKSHAVGTYIYFNSHVYKVTSAIIVGDTIAVGTNIAVDPDLLADDVAGIEGMPGGGSSKQQGYIIPASESVTVDAGSTTIVPLTIIGDGAISVTSSDSTKATGSVSNGVLTVTGVGGGIVTITITMADSSTYLGTSATVSVTSVPNGSTVTPTDDVQTWLHCAGIFDKSYTTISQVLADSSTLGTLISSTNAVNYMVRSTSWATTVCANSTAMSLIGLNNYCANTLLADSTWLNAIANSTYIESVMNVKVPTMTSNTTPSGVCSAEDYYGQEAYPAWKAFDGVLGALNGWIGEDPKSGSSWVQYQFPSSVTIKIFAYAACNNTRYWTGKLKASNDGSTFTTLLSNINGNNDSLRYVVLSNSTAYKYYRLYVTKTGIYAGQVGELQFYGREDV